MSKKTSGSDKILEADNLIKILFSQQEIQQIESKRINIKQVLEKSIAQLAARSNISTIQTILIINNNLCEELKEFKLDLNFSKRFEVLKNIFPEDRLPLALANPLLQKEVDKYLSSLPNLSKKEDIIIYFNQAEEAKLLVIQNMFPNFHDKDMQWLTRYDLKDLKDNYQIIKSKINLLKACNQYFNDPTLNDPTLNDPTLAMDFFKQREKSFNDNQLSIDDIISNWNNNEKINIIQEMFDLKDNSTIIPILKNMIYMILLKIKLHLMK